MQRLQMCHKPQTALHTMVLKSNLSLLYQLIFLPILTLICVSQLDNLPENSPINIVQTPIPITTSVPKRAKSQRKKALAAALATAQEYSEISMEQKKLKVLCLLI